MKPKIILIGIDYHNCLEIAQELIKIDDNLSISPKFTSDKNYQGLNETLDFFMDLTNIYLAYKNNALLYVNTDINNISIGITIDDFLNNDISIIPIKDFNMISDKILNDYNILVIWLDSKSKGKEDFNEIKYLQDRLQTLTYMYFYDESKEDICSTIFKYLDSPEDIKIKILENNS